MDGLIEVWLGIFPESDSLETFVVAPGMLALMYNSVTRE